MKRFIIAFISLAACTSSDGPKEQYGFVARLGNDTVSVESVTRSANSLTSDEVDRFPRVSRRHTDILLNPDGSIKHLVMDIHTPSEPANKQDRHVEVDVTSDAVHISKRDKTGTLEHNFKTDGGISMGHLPQMYSLYELYFAAALKHAKVANIPAGKPIQMRQFYIDREFDNFPLGHGVVRMMPDGKAEIQHDWLSGTGEATLDSAYRLLHYSGARSTYKVEVERLATPPNVDPIFTQFAALEAKNGGMKQLSVRDTARGTVGNATFAVDYARPLARGRALVGTLIPYGQVWRTGANAATQFTTSAPITLAGLQLPAGKYTLWTLPHPNGVDLIVNKQTGQWGTEYNASQDLGRAPMKTDSATTPVDEFTISIQSDDARNGALVMEWGPFRWTAPIVVK
jgi:DUF2911 family protein